MPADCHVTQSYVPPHSASPGLPNPVAIDMETRALGPHAFLANHRQESVYRGTSFARRTDWSAFCSPNMILTLRAMSPWVVTASWVRWR